MNNLVVVLVAVVLWSGLIEGYYQCRVVKDDSSVYVERKLIDHMGKESWTDIKMDYVTVEALKACVLKQSKDK